MCLESKKASAKSSLRVNEMPDVVEATDLRAIRSAWQQVFSTNDAFTWPFRGNYEGGHIFHPTDGYHLTREQYSALVDAAHRTGESSFFLSLVEPEGLSFLDRGWGHWSCGLPSYEEYYELDIPLENALYSKDGRWGVLISHEMHAVIGGTRAFMAALDDYYQGWANDIRMLREAWSGNANATWLEPIISRMAP